MNARSQIFELSVEGRQVTEVVSSIFHTLLFHRTLGKFTYQKEGSYSVGTIGYEDVTCDFVDFTYVRCASYDLDQTISKDITAFSNILRSNEGPGSGQISLEFYQKKQGRWLFAAESTPWEVWTLKITIVTLSNEHERQMFREKMGDILADKVLAIAAAMNRNEYIPKMPGQSELEFIFDTSYSDIQPYLYKITYQTSSLGTASVSTAVRRLFRDTLTL